MNKKKKITKKNFRIKRKNIIKKIVLATFCLALFFLLFFLLMSGLFLYLDLKGTHIATEQNLFFLNQTEPYYLTGLNAIFINQEGSFKSTKRYFSNRIKRAFDMEEMSEDFSGIYYQQLKMMAIATGRGEEKAKVTLCHELLHHEWDSKLSREEKEIWQEEYDYLLEKIGKEKMDSIGRYNADEVRAYQLSETGICFTRK